MLPYRTGKVDKRCTFRRATLDMTTARLTGTMYGNSILAFSTDFTGPPASLRSFLLSARLPLRITCFLAAIIFTFDLNLPVVLIVWFVCFHLSIQHGGGGLG